jgi:hypothetical protein
MPSQNVTAPASVGAPGRVYLGRALAEQRTGYSNASEAERDFLVRRIEAEVGQLEVALHSGDAQGVLRQALAVARLVGRAAAIGVDHDAVRGAAEFLGVAEAVLGEVLP